MRNEILISSDEECQDISSLSMVIRLESSSRWEHVDVASDVTNITIVSVMSLALSGSPLLRV